MRWAILDTTIYFGHWGRGLYEDALTSLPKTYVIRHSADDFELLSHEIGLFMLAV